RGVNRRWRRSSSGGKCTLFARVLLSAESNTSRPPGRDAWIGRQGGAGADDAVPPASSGGERASGVSVLVRTAGRPLRSSPAALARALLIAQGRRERRQAGRCWFSPMGALVAALLDRRRCRSLGGVGHGG